MLELKFFVLTSHHQWIAPPNLQPRINRLIQEFGIKTEDQYDKGDGLLYFNGKRTKYSGEVSDVEDFKSYNRIIEKMDRLASQIPKEEPWNSNSSEEILNFPTPHHWLLVPSNASHIRMCVRQMNLLLKECLTAVSVGIYYSSS